MAKAVFFNMLRTFSWGRTTFLFSLNWGNGGILLGRESVDPVEGRSGREGRGVFVVHRQLDLGAAQFTGDAHELLDGDGGGAGLGDLGLDTARDGHVEVSGGQLQAVVGGFEEDVRQDGQGGAGADHVLDGLESGHQLIFGDR
jgi:hypothetical protein